MAEIPTARWPKWSWLMRLVRLARLKQRWDSPPAAREAAARSSVVPPEPQLASPTLRHAQPAHGDPTLSHLRESRLPERQWAPPISFTAAEWQRLSFVRWRYLHGRLSEFPRE